MHIPTMQQFQFSNLYPLNDNNGFMVNIDTFLVRVILLTEEIYIIEHASSVHMAGYCSSSPFACYWTETKLNSVKRGQYQDILTELAWSIKDLLYGIPRLHVALCFFLLCLPGFVAICKIFLQLINIFVFIVVNALTL